MKNLWAVILFSGLLGSCAGQSREGEAVTEIGPATPAATDTLLFGVRDVAVDAGGDLWVLSQHEPFIRRFRAGQLVASFGRQGEGPGEFRAPRSFVRGDQAIPPRVFDPGVRLLIRLDTAGRELSRAPFRTTWGFVRGDIEEVSHGEVSRAVAISDRELVGLVYLGDVGTTRDLRRSALVRFTTVGTPVDTLLSFHKLFGGEPGQSDARWLVPVPLMAGCEDGTVAVYDAIEAEIRGYSGSGPMWRMALPTRLVRRRGMPADDLERYVRHRVLGELLENQAGVTTLETRVAQQLRGAGSLYASAIPPVVGLLCDPQGRVWLQEFDTRDDPVGRGRTWTVMDRQGGIAVVAVPRGFAPLVFSRDALIGIVRDSVGAESVGAVTLPPLTPTPGGV